MLYIFIALLLLINKDMKKGEYSMRLFIDCIRPVLKVLSKRKYRKSLLIIFLFITYVLIFKDTDILKDIFKFILLELIKKYIFR